MTVLPDTLLVLLRVLLPHVDLASVRQDKRKDMTGGRAVTRQRDDCGVGFANLEDVLARNTDGAEPRGAAARKIPVLNLAGLRILDLQRPSHVRIHPHDAGHDARNRGALVLIEFSLNRVVRRRWTG